jgi:predicted lipoprotein with Yx(FWY)xxD motif
MVAGSADSRRLEVDHDHVQNPPIKGASMTRNRCTSFLARAAVVPLAALAVAGYGGVSYANGSTTPQEATKAKPATVRVAKTKLGNVLVNSKGRTLYMFQADQGTTSACNDACATQWPPLDNATPKAGKGAKASLVSTSTRADGKQQVVYNGHPVYTFLVDKKAGDTNGQGVNAFGGLWFALTSAGNQVTANASPSTTSGSSGGSPGY